MPSLRAWNAVYAITSFFLGGGPPRLHQSELFLLSRIYYFNRGPGDAMTLRAHTSTLGRCVQFDSSEACTPAGRGGLRLPLYLVRTWLRP
ncbi:hypothetical protein EVAR_45887_1 [Eumeta japonica]|uniref:Uncharacterized protein n=1 Tax=Eumeta variegata TaxID=151549 RepID=A0A4C1XUS6_EUMVA|nr:hypothetical protein EVAR_45887_1 [Eumeta japonica]